MEQEKKKITIKPEQIEKACKMMGKTAGTVDSAFTNAKENLGPVGASIGFAVIITFLIAIVSHPGLLWIAGLSIAIGLAPSIHKKYIDIKKKAEENKEKRKEKEETKEEEKK